MILVLLKANTHLHMKYNYDAFKVFTLTSFAAFHGAEEIELDWDYIAVQSDHLCESSNLRLRTFHPRLHLHRELLQLLPAGILL